MARRAFQLPEADRNFLDTTYPLLWETVVEGQTQWVILDEFKMPTGYNHEKVAVALRIAPTYPATEIDMAYFKPDLARADGNPIGALTPLQIDNQTWQQWSRHRPSNAWRPDIDNIESHLMYVRAFLEGELKK
ncbi:hypothetical protein BH24ACI3_BH24ACI3_03930 [soil metagenome]